MTEWLQQHELVIWWLVALSVFTFLVSLIVMPLLVVRIPPDYFSRRHRYRAPDLRQMPLPKLVLLAGKNLLGCFFLVAGCFMLVLPGQGILSILVGLGLLNFPGKFKLERWLVGHPHIMKSMNWLRIRAGKSPLTPVKPEATITFK